MTVLPGLAMRVQVGGVGDQFDLPEVWIAREQDQLVAARRREARNRVSDAFLCGEGTGHDPVDVVTGEAVVVAEVLPGLLLGLVAEAHIPDRDQAGFTLAPGNTPGVLGLVRPGGERVGTAAAGDPARAVLRH